MGRYHNHLYGTVAKRGVNVAKIENIIKEYLEYQDKIGRRIGLYRVVSQSFGITSALYPGSHIDISPSLVIPRVVYVDSFSGTIGFFRNIELIKAYIDANKEYVEGCDISFIGQDYSQRLMIEPVDLVISQYAGFVGQATKDYLKTGGILLCNDSHGDATISRFDDDFEFIGVIDRNSGISDANLDDYFAVPRGRGVDLRHVMETMKGPKYSLAVENYLFRKIGSSGVQ